MMNKNFNLQFEEQEALKSIFPKQWRNIKKAANTFSIKVGKDVELWVTLNDYYPLEKPPSYELFAPKLSKTEKDFVDREFRFIYVSSKGGPVIFQWIEKLKEIVESSATLRTDKENKLLPAFERQKSMRKTKLPWADFSRQKSMEKPKLPVPVLERQKSMKNSKSPRAEKIAKKEDWEIIHGPTITDRKSTFQGHVCRITDASQVDKLIEKLKENKKISNAKHNSYAYRIRTDKNTLLQDSDDDGESYAGGRLLRILHYLDLQNVLVIVTRWYGGIHLGPERFRHYNNAARRALVQAELIS